MLSTEINIRDTARWCRYIRLMAKKTPPDQKRVQIGIKLPPDVLDLIDAKRAEYPVPVTRTWVIEQAIRAYCDNGGQFVTGKDVEAVIISNPKLFVENIAGNNALLRRLRERAGEKGKKK